MAKSTAKSSKKKEENSVFDLLPKSWELVKKNWQVFAFAYVFSILGTLSEIANSGDKSAKNDNFGTQFYGSLTGAEQLLISGSGLLLVLMSLVFFFFTVMQFKLGLESAKDRKPNIDELFEYGRKYFFRLFGLVFLCILITVIGFLLLIVPGIIAISRLTMAPYLMLDKDLGIIEAIKQSNKLATGKIGVVWAAIGLTIAVGIAASILNVLPIIGPIAGLIITIGYSLIIPLRYIQMKKHQV